MTVLQKQFEACEQSALMMAHNEAMQCREIEELVETATALFAVVLRLHRDWNSKIKTGEIHLTAKECDAQIKMIQAASKVIEPVSACIAIPEGRGFDVEGAAEFRRAKKEIMTLEELPHTLEDAILSAPDRPARLTHDQLIEIAANNPPPQEWFDEDYE